MTAARTAGMSPRPDRRRIGFVRAALAVVVVAGVGGLWLPGVAAAPVGGTSAVWGWGINYTGELGTGTQVSSSTPVPTSGLASATSIASWQGHNLAVAPDGTVWEWGNTAPGSPTPAQVCSWVVPPGSRYSKDCHTVPTEVTSLPAGLKATAVATGGWDGVFNLALMADGTVWAWGDNSLGQLGFGTTNPGGSLAGTEDVGALGPSSGPGPVRRVDGTVLNHIKAIAAGGFGSLALADDGSVWTWGEDAYGVGPGLPGCALPEGVFAFCAAQAVMGPGGVGHLNLGANGSISAGYDFDLAIGHVGGATHLWGWGSDGYGELGIDHPITTQQWDFPTPTLLHIPGGSDVTAVAAAPEGDWAAAVEGDGTVWEWGADNPDQMVPLNADRPPISPQMVPFPPGVVISTVAAGGGYSGPEAAAVDTKGNLFTWGLNLEGQIGNGTVGQPDTTGEWQLTPVELASPKPVVLVSVGDGYVLAVAGVAPTPPKGQQPPPGPPPGLRPPPQPAPPNAAAVGPVPSPGPVPQLAPGLVKPSPPPPAGPPPPAHAPAPVGGALPAPTASPAASASPGTSPAPSPATGASPAASPVPVPAPLPGVSPAASPGVSPAASPGVSPAASPGVSPAASPGVSPAAPAAPVVQPPGVAQSPAQSPLPAVGGVPDAAADYQMVAHRHDPIVPPLLPAGALCLLACFVFVRTRRHRVSLEMAGCSRRPVGGWDE